MNFSKLRLSNFKGFSEATEFDLRPLTFFYGANSSGKSSAIHALAALSQTLKLPNDRRPLILDDERALINLGRFIEVIHSKKYTDFIHLGFDLIDAPFVFLDTDGTPHRQKIAVVVDLFFGCSRRNQEIFLQKAKFAFGDTEIKVEKVNEGQRFLLNPGNLTGPLILQTGFLPDVTSLFAEIAADTANLESLRPLVQKLFSLTSEISSRVTKVIYLGPFRRPPSRKYDTHGSIPTEVGAQGESCATLLANEAIQSTKPPHITQISAWLELLGLGKKVRLERIGKSDSFGLDITLPDEKSLPISDLGFGLSQVLPVLTQCSFAQTGSTLLFEQPELHLHPKAQAPLTEIFSETVTSKKCQILAETHSPELIRSALRLLRKGKISLQDLAIYKIERKNKKSQATRLEIYSNGNDYDVSIDWEKDFLT